MFPRIHTTHLRCWVTVICSKSSHVMRHRFYSTRFNKLPFGLAVKLTLKFKKKQVLLIKNRVVLVWQLLSERANVSAESPNDASTVVQILSQWPNWITPAQRLGPSRHVQLYILPTHVLFIHSNEDNNLSLEVTTASDTLAYRTCLSELLVTQRLKMYISK